VPFEAKVKIAADGSMLIPAAFRKALGLKAGDEVALRWEGDELCIATAKPRIDRAKRPTKKRVKPNAKRSPAATRR